MADYAGHAPESSGKLALATGGDLTLVAPADRGSQFDLAAWFEANPDAAGAAAFDNGYPRHDGRPASSGHFGG